MRTTSVVLIGTLLASSWLGRRRPARNRCRAGEGKVDKADGFEIVNLATVFRPDTPLIVCVYKVEGAGLGMNTKSVWIAEDVETLLIGASGWLWSVFDHGANNYNANYRDALNGVLQVVTGDGYFSVYIFVLGVCVAVELDLYFAYLALPRLAEVKLPAFPSSREDLRRAWRYLLMRREFAYAIARYRRATGLPRARAAVVAASIDAGLQNWHLSAGGENRA